MTEASAGAPDLTELLSVALDAARGAGDLLVSRRPRHVTVAATKSTPTDIVTEMDRASERLLVETIRAARPFDGFLGEEGASEPGTSGIVWVLDPIDGTVNYLYDQPSWAVSVAAELHGEAVVGVVLCPPLGETYTAVRGGGAFRNGVRLHANDPVALDRALVATGFGYAAQRRASQARVLTGLLPVVRDIRRLGSAAMDLCALAAGRVDAYYERGVQRWDTSAAALIASEAGAVVGGLHGAPASGELTLAAGVALFGPLRDLLERADADRD